jgi:hypothetical protein
MSLSSTVRVRNWRANNPEKVLALYEKRDKIAARARASAWDAKNPKRRKEIKDACDIRRRTDPAVWAKHMVNSLRGRSKRKGIPFDLTADDLLKFIPEDSLCPALGIPIIFGGKLSRNSPSVDRLIPSLGYVKENVCIISHKANSMKQDCIDPAELRQLAAFIESKLSGGNDRE